MFVPGKELNVLTVSVLLHGQVTTSPHVYPSARKQEYHYYSSSGNINKLQNNKCVYLGCV